MDLHLILDTYVRLGLWKWTWILDLDLDLNVGIDLGTLFSNSGPGPWTWNLRLGAGSWTWPLDLKLVFGHRIGTLDLNIKSQLWNSVCLWCWTYPQTWSLVMDPGLGPCSWASTSNLTLWSHIKTSDLDIRPTSGYDFRTGILIWTGILDLDYGTLALDWNLGLKLNLSWILNSDIGLIWILQLYL